MTDSLPNHLPPADRPCVCGLSLPAHRLNNGARLLALAPTNRVSYWLVLATDEHDLVNPFVTFLADPDGNTISGHYHSSLAEAWAELERRVAQERADSEGRRKTWPG